jgi:hypothetical protein
MLNLYKLTFTNVEAREGFVEGQESYKACCVEQDDPSPKKFRKERESHDQYIFWVADFTNSNCYLLCPPDSYIREYLLNPFKPQNTLREAGMYIRGAVPANTKQLLMSAHLTKLVLMDYTIWEGGVAEEFHGI